jgi:hypothetical protein
MAEDRRQPDRGDRDGHVEASEIRRHLDVMNVAAPIPSQTPSTVAPSQPSTVAPGAATAPQATVPKKTPPPPPDYDG